MSDKYRKINGFENQFRSTVIAPFSFYGIDEIMLAYDGSASSVYAIKQFAYLFTELTSNLTLLTFVARNNEELPHKINIEELAARHY